MKKKKLLHPNIFENTKQVPGNIADYATDDQLMTVLTIV
jgi:hypothetical protein